MSAERIRASYVIETPLDPAAVAEIMAGEQSCGTFYACRRRDRRFARACSGDGRVGAVVG